MIERLETIQSKRMFFVIIGLFLLVVFLTLYLYIPYYIGEPIKPMHSLMESILEKLFTSILVTVGLALCILWLNPKKIKNAEMNILQSYEIKKYFVESRLNTKEWWFNGGSGRYTRNVTLPYLAKVCREENRTINMNIQIMNPNNTDICKAYANYKNSIRTSTNKIKRNKTEVQYDLLATIISAYMWKEEQSLLNIRICLKDCFSLFRIDLSENMVIITREDPNEPAIVYKKESFFYTAYYNELVQGFNQFRQLNMTHDFIQESDLSKDEILKLINKLDLSLKIDNEGIDQIIKLINDKTTPYT